MTFLKADGKGGIVVKRVKEGGPCEGVLQEGDRVLSFDGEKNDWFTDKDIVRLTMGMPGTEVCMYVCMCVCMCVLLLRMLAFGSSAAMF